jgi:hypothetical protein
MSENPLISFASSHPFTNRTPRSLARRRGPLAVFTIHLLFLLFLLFLQFLLFAGNDDLDPGEIVAIQDRRIHPFQKGVRLPLGVR